MSKWYILSPFKVLVQELVLLPNYWQFFSQVLLKIAKNLVFVPRITTTFAVKLRIITGFLEHVANKFVNIPKFLVKVANLMAKNCRAIQLTNSKLACFANFLYFFATYFAHFAKLFVKISNNLCLLWVNFPTKKLAIIAKNFAKGKNVTQLFGNYLGCLML